MNWEETRRERYVCVLQGAEEGWQHSVNKLCLFLFTGPGDPVLSSILLIVDNIKVFGCDLLLIFVYLLVGWDLEVHQQEGVACKAA